MDSCKIVDTAQITVKQEDYMKGLAKCTFDFAKEQARSEYSDIPKEAIDDLYESHICKAICVKSKDEYEKFRAEGYSQEKSSRMALVNELISLREKGVLSDDLATENVIRNIKNGSKSHSSKSFSKNFRNAHNKFIRSASEICYSKSFAYSCLDPKLAEYYLGTIAKFNIPISVFIKESMDFYIDNHQQELEEIKRREDAKNEEEANEKEKASEKNSRLFG